MLHWNSVADLLKTGLSLKYFAKFLIVLALMWGCGEDEKLAPDAGAAYFPLQTSVYQVYAVTETHYQVTSAPMTSEYELMTHVVDSFSSVTGEFTWVIHRSKRATGADSWELLDTWSARTDGNAIILSEENTAYVKLQFPLREGTEWDGNTFNSLGEDIYALKAVRRPLALNGVSFENTVTVEQELNEDRIVFRDERTEIYAENVGLVYREMVQLDYCTADACLGQQKVDEGVEMKMTIIDYGRK